MLYKQGSIFSCSSLFPHFVHIELPLLSKEYFGEFQAFEREKGNKSVFRVYPVRPMSLAVFHLGYIWHDASWLMGPSMQARFLYSPLSFFGKKPKSLGMMEKDWNAKTMWVSPGIWLLCILNKILLYIPKCHLWSLFSFQIHAMIPIVMMPCSLVIVKTYIDHGV